MRLRIDRDMFATTVSWVARAIQPNPAKPVLGGVLIEAEEDGTINMSSNDPAIGARAVIEASVEEAGTCVVNGRLLRDYTKELPNKPLEIVTNDQRMKLSCGNAEMTISLLPIDEYPVATELPKLAGTVDGEEWATALGQVAKSSSNDDTLPLLTSICLVINGAKITLMATDRYRLSVRELDWKPVDPAVNMKVLVRAGRLAEVAKALDCVSTVDLFLDEDSRVLGMEAGGRRNILSRTEGEYPDVLGLFPAEANSTAVVEREALLDALRRARLVVEKNSAVRLAFSEGQVEINAGQGDIAAFCETLEATLEGDDIQMAFNPNYLNDALGSMSSPFVEFSFTQPSKPTLIKPLEKEGGEAESDFKILQMPIRLYD